MVEFKLFPQNPFSLDLTAWILRRRQKNQIDEFENGVYSRVFAIDDKVILSRITQQDDALKVRLESSSDLGDSPAKIAEILKKMLGLETNLEKFYRIAHGDDQIKSLAEKFIGCKPTIFPTVYEGLVNAVANQQVSLDAGLSVINKLSVKFGKRFENGEIVRHAFPMPSELAKANEQDLKELGLSHQKSRTIINLSKMMVVEKSTFDDLETKSNEKIVNALTKIPGIGRWSAEYVLLRGFGRIDTFPGDDVGAQNNIQRLFNLSKKPGYDEIKKLVAKWHPFEGLIYFHLLLDKLHQKQLIEAF